MKSPAKRQVDDHPSVQFLTMLLHCLLLSTLLPSLLAYTTEEDARFEQFLRFALDLKQQVFGSKSRSKRQSGGEAGYYALPLPYMPQDVQANLGSMQMVGHDAPYQSSAIIAGNWG